MARPSLKNSNDILNLLTNITNKLLNGEIEESKARCIYYGCSVAGGIIKTHELEKRLEKLEENSK